jgi:voltage-gated potassium channel Kch
MIVSYALLFAWLHVLPERGFQAALYFSVVTFTTLGYGDLIPAKQFRLLAASEALVGLLLVGLFLFTLSRRAVGRG